MATKKPEGRKDPKEYMKLAVEVMKKSIPERKKQNPSPYVGAVLVFPDGTVETAHRGELREGDHAEYTLLDKKNRIKSLKGCWLFATLEPCAPGARKAPKISCAERIVSARISEVWFGIEDKNPTVNHGGIDHLLENKVKVHQLREFKEMELLEYDSKKKKYLPTGNAILLFGKSPRNKFPQSAVKAKVHYGDGKTGTQTFDDALVLVPDEVASAVLTLCQGEITTTGSIFYLGNGENIVS